MVVGGYALAAHGRPRYTGDIDFWVKPTERNAARLIAALNQFGFGAVGLTLADFTRSNSVVQLGYPPSRIDLLTSIDGVDFEAAYVRCLQFEIDGVTLPILHVEDLKTNKRAVGRPQDLADLESLQRGSDGSS
jgi:hypothetical protein